MFSLSTLASLYAELWIVPNELLLAGTIVVLALLWMARRYRKK